MPNIPSFAIEDTLTYPERANKLSDLSLPFYCINCQRKSVTKYLTPDFGPFCQDCINELKTKWQLKDDQQDNGI